MYVHIYIYAVRICIQMYLYVSKYLCNTTVYIYTYIYIHVCICICLYLCYVYIYISSFGDYYFLVFSLFCMSFCVLVLKEGNTAHNRSNNVAITTTTYQCHSAMFF